MVVWSRTLPAVARRMTRCSSPVSVVGERCGTRTGSLGGGGRHGDCRGRWGTAVNDDTGPDSQYDPPRAGGSVSALIELREVQSGGRCIRIVMQPSDAVPGLAESVPRRPAGEDAADVRDRLPHVVILGGGFGGLYAARALAGAPVRVTVVDKRNHHVFQPLLYQVARPR